jgi:hypothetical protein
MRRIYRHAIAAALSASALGTSSAADGQQSLPERGDPRNGGYAASDPRLASVVPDGATARIAGKWIGGMMGPDGPAPLSLELEESGGTLNGTFDLAGLGPLKISEGTISGNEVSFNVVIGCGESMLVRGRINNGTLSLEAESSFGSGYDAFTLARVLGDQMDVSGRPKVLGGETVPADDGGLVK